ncbi:MAG: hypothetical protein R3B46_12515 [Phycisphaerales bacterium]
MTAGRGIYIGTQGILQGTYETFAEVASSTGRRTRTTSYGPLAGRLASLLVGAA